MRAAMIDSNSGSKVLSIIQHYDDLVIFLYSLIVPGNNLKIY